MTLRTARNFSLILAMGISLLPGEISVIAQKRRRILIPKEVVRQMVNYGEDMGEEVRVEAVDLNNDGRTEVIVQSGCAVVGNCSTWIFRKIAGGYQLLLNDEAQMIRTLTTRTNGYRDIVFKIHGSAYESNFLTYKFDGEQYHLKECLYRNYSYIDEQGRLQVRKRPKVTRCALN